MPLLAGELSSAALLPFLPAMPTAPLPLPLCCRSLRTSPGGRRWVG